MPAARVRHDKTIAEYIKGAEPALGATLEAYQLPFDGFTLGYSLAELSKAIRPNMPVARLRKEWVEGRLVMRRCGNRGIVSRTAALEWLNNGLPLYTRKDQSNV
jgi:hypothetical protein